MFVKEILYCPECGAELRAGEACAKCGVNSQGGNARPARIESVYYCSRCMRRIEADGVCPHCGYDHRTGRNESPALCIGTLLCGRYQLGTVLGQGSYGITYAGWDETLEVPVAIKEYFPQGIAVREEMMDAVCASEGHEMEFAVCRDRFLREARVLAMMQEMPGVVRVQNHFEENETAYIVMEYLHGETLAQYAASHAIGAKELLDRLLDPVNALDALHRQGILHCDIKPQNIMVLEDGRMKLIDFGAAAQVDRNETVRFGSPGYAAIEQEQTEEGKYSIGAWTDVYGLCATIYDVLSGGKMKRAAERVLSDGLKPIRKLCGRLKRRQAKAIMDGLAVKPDRRIQSMAELRALLYNMPLPEEARRRRRILRGVTAIAAIFTALTLVLSASFFLGYIRPQILVWPYDEEYAALALKNVRISYDQQMGELDSIEEVLKQAASGNIPNFLDGYKAYAIASRVLQSYAQENEDWANRILQIMTGLGQVFEWSERSLDEYSYLEMIERSGERNTFYGQYMPLLRRIVPDEELREAYADEYIALLSDVLQCDRRAVSSLNAMVVGNFVNMNPAQRVDFLDDPASVWMTQKDRETLSFYPADGWRTQYMKDLRALWKAEDALSAFAEAFIAQHGEDGKTDPESQPALTPLPIPDVAIPTGIKLF